MQDIQHAISALSASQRASLASWLEALNADQVGEAAATYHASPDQRLMSVDEYLQFDLQATTKHECVAGRVYAMSGPTLRHNLITRNLVIALSRHLNGGPCRAFFSDIKVHLRINKAEIFYYPDVVVACGALEIAERELREPKLIVEVLSPSTESIDRREKAFNYQQIPSMEEYVRRSVAPRFSLADCADGAAAA